MKKILTLLGIFILIQAIAYYAAAFYSWEYNPGKWDVGTRFFVVFMGLTFGVVGCTAYFGYEESKK